MWPTIQGGRSASLLQGGGSSSGLKLQGSGANVQPALTIGKIQPAGGIPRVNTAAPKAASLGATTTPDVSAADSAAAQAAAEAAANAAKAAQLRGEVTDIANRIKSIFNSRFGQAEAQAKEQSSKLDQRYATESSDVTKQVEQENQQLGAAHAASGTYDSSYRGNNVDTVTQGGEAQLRDLGTELSDNQNSIAGWLAKEKASANAQKSGMDSILSRLGESTDVNELASLRNTLDSRITELSAGSADNNTAKDNKSTLEKIAPSNVRAQQLKTTLSAIVAGNADPNQKLAIASKLIQNAGLNPNDEDTLLSGVTSELQKQEQA